jgi:hypothetical protein
MLDDPQSIHAKLDRVILCLEGEPLEGKLGLVGEVKNLKARMNKRSRIESRIFKAAGLGFLGAAGAGLWAFISGRHS